MAVIVSCGCDGVDEFVKDAFKVLFPSEQFPQYISGKPAVTAWGDIVGGKTGKRIKALARSTEKFAHYFADEGNDEGEEWDLLEGVRVR